MTHTYTALNMFEERATNAYTRETGSSIPAGIAIPAAGCWQMRGEYRGTEFSFVVEVKF